MMYYPIILKGDPLEHLTDDEFYHFCQMNPDVKMERNNELEIIIMSPTGSESGKIEANVIGQIYAWNIGARKGNVFSSSAGFSLPDGSVFSPDAAFISLERWNAIPADLKKKFAPIVPDFVAEIVSESDDLNRLKHKMERWMLNGVRLAFLIFPEKQISWVYEPGAEIREVTGFNHKLSGSAVLPGFELDLSLLNG